MAIIIGLASSGSGVQDLLAWLLRSSGEAAVIAALVLVTQLLLGRCLSSAWRFRLWGLVVLRLVLPVSPAASFSVWNLAAGHDAVDTLLTVAAQPPAAMPTGNAPAVEHPASPAPDARPTTVIRYSFAVPPAVDGKHETIDRRASALPPSPAAPAPVPPAPSGAATPQPLIIAAAVWLSVSMLLLARLIIANILFTRRLRRGIPVTNAEVLALLQACAESLKVPVPPLLICDAVRSPATAGIWRPRVLLPKGLVETLSAAELRAVFLHELAHVRSRDVATNWLLAVLQAIHWFNPIVWLAFARLRSDREIARDAMVLKITSANDPCDAATTANAYGQTLLRLAERVSATVAGRGGPLAHLTAPPATAGMIGDGIGPVASGLFSRRPDLHRRLCMIARFRRAADRRFVLMGPALFIAIGCGALTGPRAKTPAATQPVAAAPAKSIAELEAQSRALTKEQRFGEALEVVKQILQRDPQNDYATGVRPLLEDRWTFVQQRRYQETDEQKQAERRAEDERRLQAKLDRKIPELNVQNMTLEETVALLRDISGADIFVNWRALETAGIERTKPITVRLFNVKFAKALTVILDNASGPTRKSHLEYAVEEGVVTISTRADLSKNVLTRVYDVRDLIIASPEPKDAPLWSLQKHDAEPVRAAPVPPATQPDGKLVSAPATRPAPATTHGPLDDVITLIKETVAPDSWEGEDRFGSIKELSGQLIITQTPENQAAIAQLIEQLRETRSLQIMIEATFLSCDEQKVNEMVARWKADRLNAPATAPGSTSGSATLFITEEQSKQLLQAAQERGGMSVLAAPRLLVVNGQQASVRTGGDHPYKSDYRMVKDAAGRSRYEPMIAYAESGWLLDATATVSADRKYVTLKLRPQIAVFEGMVETPWPHRREGSDLMIQTPQLKISEIRTAIAVPDGGTLLLGGLPDPGIADPPGKPAETRPATQPAGRKFYLLVKPQTIVQQEIPQRAFPLLQTRPSEK